MIRRSFVLFKKVLPTLDYEDVLLRFLIKDLLFFFFCIESCEYEDIVFQVAIWVTQYLLLKTPCFFLLYFTFPLHFWALFCSLESFSIHTQTAQSLTLQWILISDSPLALFFFLKIFQPFLTFAYTHKFLNWLVNFCKKQ